MTQIVLVHHVQGLTEGVRALAAALGSGGHTVHTPDLYDGRVAASLEDGFGLVTEIGEDLLAERLDAALAGLPDEVVYAGISYGVQAAQRLAQTRPGAHGALLYEAFIPITGEWAFGPWPTDVPVQVHGMERDPYFGLEGDLDAARELVETVGTDVAELFVYPGEQHLFIDSSLPSYDEAAATLAIERSRAFLDRLG